MLSRFYSNSFWHSVQGRMRAFTTNNGKKDCAMKIISVKENDNGWISWNWSIRTFEIMLLFFYVKFGELKADTFWPYFQEQNWEIFIHKNEFYCIKKELIFKHRDSMICWGKCLLTFPKCGISIAIKVKKNGVLGGLCNASY